MQEKGYLAEMPDTFFLSFSQKDVIDKYYRVSVF